MTARLLRSLSLCCLALGLAAPACSDVPMATDDTETTDAGTSTSDTSTDAIGGDTDATGGTETEESGTSETESTGSDTNAGGGTETGACGDLACGNQTEGCVACAIAGDCQAAFEACDASEACQALAVCLTGCDASDTACADACAVTHSEGVATFNAYGSCVYGDVCAATCNGGTGTNGGDDAVCAEETTCGDTTSGCIACAVAGPCKTAFDACEGIEGCRNLSICLADCTAGDTACVDTCRSTHADGTTTFDAYATCVFGDVCADTCAANTDDAASCAEETTCGDTTSGCIACAVAGTCKTAFDACEASDGCRNLSICLADCTAGDTACVDTCRSVNAEGTTTFDAYASCVFSDVCADVCQ